MPSTTPPAPARASPVAAGLGVRARADPARPGRDRRSARPSTRPRALTAARRRRQHRGRRAARQLPDDEPRSRSCCGPPIGARRRAGRRTSPSRRPGATEGATAGPSPGRRRGRHRGVHGRPGRRPATPTTRRASRSSATQLREDAPDGVTVQVTGPAAIHADLGQVFDGADIRLLLATAAIVAILLVITYRSPVLWLVPLDRRRPRRPPRRVLADPRLEAVGVAVGRLDHRHPLGARLRRRHRLRAAADLPLPRRAAPHRVPARGDGARAAAVPSEAVLASATTVVLGLLTLLLSPDPDDPRPRPRVRDRHRRRRVLRAGRAAGGAGALRPLGVLADGAARRRRGARRHRPRLAPGRRRGGRAARRAFVAGTLVVLAVLASGLFGIKLGLDQADQFLDQPEAVTAAERLAESFPAGTVDPTQVLTRDDPQTRSSPRSRAPRASTPPGHRLGQRRHPDRRRPRRRARVSRGTHAIEADCATAVADLPDTHVGGTEAEAIDARDAAARDLR